MGRGGEGKCADAPLSLLSWTGQGHCGGRHAACWRWTGWRWTGWRWARWRWSCVLELNTKGRYAVMAMADLAANSAELSMPLSAIAERQQISLAYLEQLFLRLRRAGLVESARGRAGGYRLGRAADSITIADVMNAVEEDMQMTRCGLDAAAPCVGGKRCLTHGLWEALGEHISQFLESVTLQQVIDGGPSRLPPRAATAPALFTGGIVTR